MMEFILYEKKENIAVITINRPRALNALNSQMLDELTEALALAEKDQQIRCVILTSAGGRAFTAGGDVKEEVKLQPEEAARFAERGKRCTLSVLNHRVPVICAVQGYALGGGMELILAGDITVAADDAKIGIPTIRLGSVPGWGSTVLLPRIVGVSRAKELLYSGRSLDAEEALKLGVVEFVKKPEELMEFAMDLAKTIADMPPVAVESMKKSINSSFESGMDECLKKETDLFSLCFGTVDHLEATTAFLEKRPHGTYLRK
ncbi:MAG: enoyl-CoA hydratase/isomerase family protein [Lachnospiraceae bacterium]|nr:enoyl-CoA hydratase/isomerase family protein [Lachnospiraceae bacterium]